VRSRINAYIGITFLLAASSSFSSDWSMPRKDVQNRAYTKEKLQPPLFLRYRYPQKEEPEEGSASVAVAKNRLYIGSKWLSRISAKKGTLKWRYKCGDRWYEGFGCPTIDKENIYVSSYDGNVYHFYNDSLVWVYKTEIGLSSSVLKIKDRLYFTAEDGVYCLSLSAGSCGDGELIWKNGDLNGLICSPPAISGNALFAGATDGFLYAFQLSSGKEIWKCKTGYRIKDAPAVSDDRVFVCSDGVYAVDAKDGELLWSRDLGSIVNTSPAVAHGMVYVGCDGGYIYALDDKTGETVWNYKTGDIVTSSPIVAGDILFVGSRDKRVYGLDALKGDSLWSYEIGAFVNGSPVAADGLLYITAEDGYLYAFSDKMPSYSVKYTEVEIKEKVKGSSPASLTLVNTGREEWLKEKVRLVCSWIDCRELKVKEDSFLLPSDVVPGDSIEVKLTLEPPKVSGNYSLIIELQKGKEASNPFFKKVKVEPITVENEPFRGNYLFTPYFAFKDTSLEENVVILADISLKDSLDARLRVYKTDVESRFPAHLIIHYGDWREPEEVREFLKTCYLDDSITGAVLVGDIPAPVFKASYGKFVASLYYEDLEGSFVDSTGDGYLDHHFWGEKGEPQIWVSWIRPPVDKIRNLKRFFNKCHMYYMERLIPPHRTLVWCDNDFGGSALITGKVLASFYGNENVETVGSRWIYAPGEDYLKKLRKGYEVVEIFTHASSLFHQANKDPDRNIYSWRIREVPQGGLMVLIWGCSAGNFIEVSNEYSLPAAYLFGNSMSQCVLAVTRPMGTGDHEYIYTGFEKGMTFGKSYLEYKREAYNRDQIHKIWTKEEPTTLIVSITLFGNPFIAPLRIRGKGVVTGPYWYEPIEGARIEFLSEEGDSVLALFTGEDGTFDYALTPGTYNVRASKNGYEPREEEITVTSDERPGISLALREEITTTPQRVFSIPMYLEEEEVASLVSDSISVRTWKGDKYEKVERLEPGRGYLIDTLIEWKLDGVEPPDDMPFTVLLNNGWNMIGNPFDFPVNWNSAYCEWVDWSVFTRENDLKAAQENRWMEPWLWEFEDGSYKLTDRLLPWRGYFIKAAKSWGYYTHTLKIPPVPYGKREERGEKRDGWCIQFICRAGEIEDSENFMGVSSKANNGFDFLDIEKSPLPDTSFAFVYSFFPHPEWGHEEGNYAHDIREGSGGRKVWSFIIKANKVEGEYVLKWKLHSLPRRYKITLVDLDNDKRIDMRKEKDHEFEGNKTKKFWILLEL